jgi:hypothetical protein
VASSRVLAACPTCVEDFRSSYSMAAFDRGGETAACRSSQFSICAFVQPVPVH